VLHTRLNRIAADAAALDGCVGYIEREIRPALETQPGSLGISVLEDRERGMAIFGSVWATSSEMSRSSGRLISETVWRDSGARAAAPSVAAIVRAEVPDEAGGEIRAVEDYALVFSTVREP